MLGAGYGGASKSVTRRTGAELIESPEFFAGDLLDGCSVGGCKELRTADQIWPSAPRHTLLDDAISPVTSR
jgi:hypothetical protein